MSGEIVKLLDINEIYLVTLRSFDHFFTAFPDFRLKIPATIQEFKNKYEFVKTIECKENVSLIKGNKKAVDGFNTIFLTMH